MRGGRAGGGEASGGRRAGFHHHKFLPLHPASAASTPRWNAKGSRTWNRRGTPWFDSPRRLHVVETVHEYTLTTVNGKRQKRFVEKNFHDRARIGSQIARRETSRYPSRYSRDACACSEDGARVCRNRMESGDVRSLEPRGQIGDAVEHGGRARCEARGVLRAEFSRADENAAHSKHDARGHVELRVVSDHGDLRAAHAGFLDR